MSLKRKLLIGGLVLVFGIIALLAALKKYHAWKYQSTSSVLREMHEYQTAHRYDDAIAVGKKFTERFPANGWNDRIFAQIALSYLEKAKKENGRSESDVASALVYRDKMLPVAADGELGWYSAGTLQSAVTISEAAGDLSTVHRCEEYGHALQLANQFLDKIELQQRKLSNLHSDTDEFGYTAKHIQMFRDESKEAIARIGDKQQKAGCH